MLHNSTQHKFETGPSKNHGPLITTERAWASARGSKRSFAPPFGNWD